MSDTKTSALTSLTGASVDPAADVLAVVDTSATTTKKITGQELFNALSTLTALVGSGVQASADSVPIYDNSVTTEKKILISELFNALISAKGDILTGSAASTFARLSVGTDGQKLIADSASSGGIKWSADDGAGALGSYSLLMSNDSTTVDRNATIAGSSMKFAYWNGSAFAHDTGTPSGTWRNMGGDMDPNGVGYVGLFQRVS